MLDLLTHPEPRKVLDWEVEENHLSQAVKARIRRKGYSGVQSLLKVLLEIAVFTESEIELDPSLLVRFIKESVNGKSNEVPEGAE